MTWREADMSQSRKRAASREGEAQDSSRVGGHFTIQSFVNLPVVRVSSGRQ